MKALTTALIILVAAGFSGCGEGGPDPARAAKAADTAAVAARARAAAEATREAERLASLWTYSEVAAGRGKQVAASIRSTTDVDTDDQLPRSVLLVFRDHPSWGQTSYLVLTAGDFKCTPRCTVSVTFDEAAPRAMAAHRPNTKEAIALIVDDAKGMWQGTSGAKQISIEFPVKAGGTRTATYAVGGLDRARMPGWDRR